MIAPRCIKMGERPSREHDCTAVLLPFASFYFFVSPSVMRDTSLPLAFWLLRVAQTR